MRVLNTSSNLFLFKDQMLNTLNVHYKKITLIVSAIFAAIGTCFLLHYFYKSQSLKAKRDINANRSSIAGKGNLLSSSTTLSSVQTVSSLKVCEKAFPQTSSQQSVMTVDSVAARDVGVKSFFKPAKAIKIEIVSDDVSDRDDDITHDEEKEEEWGELEEVDGVDLNVQKGLRQEDLDDAFGNQPLVIGESRKDESKGNRVVERKKYMIGDKHISTRTAQCLLFLQGALNRLGKEYGEAEDNGDCFWDAFAQGLSAIHNRPVTIEELRQNVGEEVRRIERVLGKGNWIKEMMNGDMMETYEEYRNRVAYSCSEAEARGFNPVWGTETRDGKILSNLYRVNLIVYWVRHSEDNDERNPFYTGTVRIPENQPYGKTVEIALYPGHFLPVRNKVRS